MRQNLTGLGTILLLAVVILSCAALVGLDKLDGDLFIAAVVGPIVGGAIGVGAQSKGVQQGSEASTTPPPGA